MAGMDQRTKFGLLKRKALNCGVLANTGSKLMSLRAAIHPVSVKIACWYSGCIKNLTKSHATAGFLLDRLTYMLTGPDSVPHRLSIGNGAVPYFRVGAFFWMSPITHDSRTNIAVCPSSNAFASCLMSKLSILYVYTPSRYMVSVARPASLSYPALYLPCPFPVRISPPRGHIHIANFSAIPLPAPKSRKLSPLLTTRPCASYFVNFLAYAITS